MVHLHAGVPTRGTSMQMNLHEDILQTATPPCRGTSMMQFHADAPPRCTSTQPYPKAAPPRSYTSTQGHCPQLHLGAAVPVCMQQLLVVPGPRWAPRMAPLTAHCWAHSLPARRRRPRAVRGCACPGCCWLLAAGQPRRVQSPAVLQHNEREAAGAAERRGRVCQAAEQLGYGFGIC